MARDPVLVDIYADLLAPFPDELDDEVIETLVEIDDGIAGIASHYVNNTRPMSPDHRALLSEYTADLDRIDGRLGDVYAREYFAQRRSLAQHLLATR